MEQVHKVSSEKRKHRGKDRETHNESCGLSSLRMLICTGQA